MKTASLFRWMLLLPALAAVPGCATHALWTDTDWDYWHKPAANPALQIYHNDDAREFLVIYKEHERHGATITRAYYLYKNDHRIQHMHPPKFLKGDPARDLDPVPVFLAPKTAPQPVAPLFAVLATNKQEFTLYSSGQDVGTYALPIYYDGRGNMARLALTPLAATADASIVGGAVAGVVAYLYAESLSNGSCSSIPDIQIRK